MPLAVGAPSITTSEPTGADPIAMSSSSLLLAVAPAPAGAVAAVAPAAGNLLAAVAVTLAGQAGRALSAGTAASIAR